MPAAPKPALNPAAPAAEWLDRLAAVVGPANAVREPGDMARWLVEPRDIFHGTAALVVRPGSTAEVSRLLAIANEGRVPIVAQSGNTGLVGGQSPSQAGNEVVLSLDRLDKLRDVDATDNTITVEAGMTLKSVQDAAVAAGRLFPLSLASEGSCRIGGNLATNAGGIGVIAYGSARDLCLGLEVVLADGRVWEGLRRLRKDNTGYDLKDLFIGSEGTLGVITAAVLKLFPAPRARATAWIGVTGPQAGLDLLDLARERGPGQVTAIELVPRIGLEFTMRHAGTRDPLTAPFDWYVLLELSGMADELFLAEGLEAVLAEGLERGILGDAVVAKSGAQAADFWRIRESLSEVQRHEGGSIKHDVSVPVSRIPDFIAEASAGVARLVPGARPVPFGHIGDGNIHFNVSQPPESGKDGADKAAFLARWENVAAAVHDVVLRLGGSISAEHGIGQLKRHLMPAVRSPVELGLMRDVKRLLDPNNILNPGKMLPEET
ncbi:MAG TPA: FAD-binding oxidoreductase [Aestuariivirgaceae bacterium]|nr:FAD-binding oxidoreductase [Aestuariivirgaceae bacterium]